MFLGLGNELRIVDRIPLLDRQTRELKMGNVYLKNFFGKVGVIQADTFGADEV